MFFVMVDAKKFMVMLSKDKRYWSTKEGYRPAFNDDDLQVWNENNQRIVEHKFFNEIVPLEFFEDIIEKEMENGPVVTEGLKSAKAKFDKIAPSVKT